MAEGSRNRPFSENEYGLPSWWLPYYNEFLGSVDKLMSGSGLSELLETCCGANTVIQLMSGRAVARALLGHMLVESALVTQLLKAIIPKSNNDEDNLPTVSEFEDSAA